MFGSEKDSQIARVPNRCGNIEGTRDQNGYRYPCSIGYQGWRWGDCEASNILKHLGVKRPLIVTDPVLIRMGLAGSLRGQIEKAGIACGVFSETVPDPTTDAVAAGLQAFVEGSMTGW